jgi:hypothetical protein
VQKLEELELFERAVSIGDDTIIATGEPYKQVRTNMLPEAKLTFFNGVYSNNITSVKITAFELCGNLVCNSKILASKIASTGT